jgi:dihydroxyacetone kinase
MSKKIFNTIESLVPDAIDGLILSNSKLRKISNLNIVVREDIEEYKHHAVTVISGGGSGHEPAQAGYIGEGMLSAAVFGKVFASPSVNSILAAIRVCTGENGCLLIVKVY